MIIAFPRRTLLHGVRRQLSQHEKYACVPEKLKQKCVSSPPQAYDNCPKWKEEVDNNHTLEEKHMFQLGPQMQALLQNVSGRLGFGYRLTFGMLQYVICIPTSVTVEQTASV
jgi:hypothetical protein